MGHPNPDVTVAICLYNSRAFIEATIESVLGQTFTNFEVVLVDDGSTDGCAEVVCSRFPDQRIRVVHQRHAGLGAARVSSVAHARGDYLAFLDHDDLWEPDKLATQIARISDCPDTGLVFCACRYIDATGRTVAVPAPVVDPATLDLSSGNAVDALLRHGCFIELSSVLMPRRALQRVGGFTPQFTYVEDYDLWLRVARSASLTYLSSPLVRRRLHARQFTQTHPDVALAEQRDLLLPVVSSDLFPPDLRQAVTAHIAGQHCECAARLFNGGRLLSGARAALGALRWPGGSRLALVYWGSRTAFGRRVRSTLKSRSKASPVVGPHDGPREKPPVTDVWVDATALDSAHTGYFGFTLDLLRVLLSSRPAGTTIHADVPDPAIPKLTDWLGTWADRLMVHHVGPASALRRSHRPPWRDGGRGIVEVVVWQGQFRYRQSERIAVIQDITPRVVPGVHPEGNLLDFEDFVRYVLRHATRIATISESSRRDILDHLPVYAPHVHVIPEHIHPRYTAAPRPPSAGMLERYAIPGPYVLTVGTIEPRKNLRRLIDAFARAVDDVGDGELTLVIAGPQGWDHGFPDYVRAHACHSRIRLVGFVPADDLPSLYAGSSLFVYPSLYEGFGRPVLEAMCCGCVVLTSDVSAMPEVLGDAGLYCNPDRTDDMTRAMKAAIRLDPGHAAQFRDAGLRRARRLLADWATRPPLPGLSGWPASAA